MEQTDFDSKDFLASPSEAVAIARKKMRVLHLAYCRELIAEWMRQSNISDDPVYHDGDVEFALQSGYAAAYIADVIQGKREERRKKSNDKETNMYEIIKSVVMQGSFELTSILHKIDIFWLKGQLTDEQRDELIKLARSYADPSRSYDLMRMIMRLQDSVSGLDDRLQRLEGTTPEANPEDVPEYEPGMAAKDGDVYQWQGKKYRCTLPVGVFVCVWAPDVMPTYWEAV